MSVWACRRRALATIWSWSQSNRTASATGLRCFPSRVDSHRTPVIWPSALIATAALPAISLSATVAAPPDTGRLAVLAARAVVVRNQEQSKQLVYMALLRERATPDLMPLVEGDFSGITDDLRQRFGELASACSREVHGEACEDDDDDSEPSEGEEINNEMTSTPAVNVGDVLAKLRWVMGHLDGDLFSDAPTLAEAYDWSSATDAEAMIVSVWADMERLFGNGEDGEIWRPTAIDRLREFDANWKRAHPGEAAAGEEPGGDA
jgi:hypothetical protein